MSLIVLHADQCVEYFPQYKRTCLSLIDLMLCPETIYCVSPRLTTEREELLCFSTEAKYVNKAPDSNTLGRSPNRSWSPSNAWLRMYCIWSPELAGGREETVARPLFSPLLNVSPEHFFFLHWAIITRSSIATHAHVFCVLFLIFFSLQLLSLRTDVHASLFFWGADAWAQTDMTHLIRLNASWWKWQKPMTQTASFRFILPQSKSGWCKKLKLLVLMHSLKVQKLNFLTFFFLLSQDVLHIVNWWFHHFG